jgi:hypothetical protein
MCRGGPSPAGSHSSASSSSASARRIRAATSSPCSATRRNKNARPAFCSFVVTCMPTFVTGVPRAVTLQMQRVRTETGWVSYAIHVQRH